MPVLKDVPVYFPGSKTTGITWPVNAGDECLVVFADACIDAWFQNGGVQNAITVRQHDYSDGFAFVGFRSKPNALTSFNTEEPEFFGIKKSDIQRAIDHANSGGD